MKTDVQVSPDGKEVYYLEQGRIASVVIESRQVKPLAVTAEMDVAFDRGKHEVFREAWTYLRDWFYDPSYHGANWEALRATYAPYVAGSATADELRRVLSLMIGELDASHLGISAPPDPARLPAARAAWPAVRRGAYEARVSSGSRRCCRSGQPTSRAASASGST